jgi:hypothetical protein
VANPQRDRRVVRTEAAAAGKYGKLEELLTSMADTCDTQQYNEAKPFSQELKEMVERQVSGTTAQMSGG